MATTYYYSVMGQIVGESTSGVRTDYLTDALGSVVATVDNTAAVVNTYRYKPYGDLLAKTGSGPDPKFLWVGSWGYWKTGNVWADAYVRARHYGSRQAGWTTADRLLPLMPLYLYTASPASIVDYSGNVGLSPVSGSCRDSSGKPCNSNDLTCFFSSTTEQAIYKCGMLNGAYALDYRDPDTGQVVGAFGVTWCDVATATIQTQICAPCCGKDAVIRHEQSHKSYRGGCCSLLRACRNYYTNHPGEDGHFASDCEHQYLAWQRLTADYSEKLAYTESVNYINERKCFDANGVPNYGRCCAFLLVQSKGWKQTLEKLKNAQDYNCPFERVDADNAKIVPSKAVSHARGGIG